MEREVTVASRVVLELVRAVERAGVARPDFVRAARVEPEWLEADDVRLPRAEVDRLCQVALDLTGDPAFGLHWGEWLAANSFNLVSHLLVHASNLRQALDTLQRFGQLVSDERFVELAQEGDTAELRTADASDAPLPIRRLTSEMLMLGLLRLIQQFAGPSARALRAGFPYPAPAHRAEYTRLFAGAERFDQPHGSLIFPRSWLHARSPQKDEGLYGTLSELAERRLVQLAARTAYALRVRHHLVQQSAPHRVTMRQAARALGLSARSLHRRLSEEGQSYVALASAASADRARRLLVDERRTIQEAAHAMGFTTVSSFHRAFRRWTGTTPAAVRHGSSRAGADLDERP